MKPDNDGPGWAGPLCPGLHAPTHGPLFKELTSLQDPKRDLRESVDPCPSSQCDHTEYISLLHTINLISFSRMGG